MIIGIQSYSIDVVTLLAHEALLLSFRTFICPSCFVLRFWPFCILHHFVISSTILIVRQLAPKQSFLYLLCLRVSQLDKISYLLLNPLHMNYQLQRPTTLQHRLSAGQGSAAGLAHYSSRPHFFFIVQEQRSRFRQHIYFTADLTPASSSLVTHDGRVNLSSHT